jgi:hypothetical protein
MGVDPGSSIEQHDLTPDSPWMGVDPGSIIEQHDLTPDSPWMGVDPGSSIEQHDLTPDSPWMGVDPGSSCRIARIGDPPLDSGLRRNDAMSRSTDITGRFAE